MPAGISIRMAKTELMRRCRMSESNQETVNQKSET